MKKQSLTILGATGTIGVNTLDVVARHRERFDVFALTGATQTDRLCQRCLDFHPRYAAMTEADAAASLRDRLRAAGSATEVLSGANALIEVATAAEVTTLMAAIVGAAGLPATIAAARAGKRILLANKETLVVSGQLFMDAVHENGAELFPIDSEHSALHQSLPAAFDGDLDAAGVKTLWLTAWDYLRFERFEIIETVDAWTIILVTVPITALAKKLKPLTAMVWGFVLATTCWFVMDGFPTVWMTVFAIVLFALGEGLQSPRYYEYVAALAPKEQVGTYMGFAFLPIAIGTFIAGWSSGWLVKTYVVGGNPLAPRMWLWVGAYGVVSTVLMLLYDRFVQSTGPSPERDEPRGLPRSRRRYPEGCALRRG